MRYITFHTLLAAFFLCACARCQHMKTHESQKAGLVRLVFGTPQFIHFSHEGIQDKLTFDFKAEKINWPKDVPNYGRRGWSIVLRGRLDIPIAGEYEFKGTGTSGMIRLGDAWFSLEGMRKLTLPVGELRFELYQKEENSRKAISCDLRWKTPEGKEFVAIPITSLTHGESDKIYHKGLRPDVLIKDIKTTLATLDGGFEIPEDGYYRFFLRCDGMFRWGNICPGSANVVIDDKTLLFYGVKNGGFFDAVNQTRYYEKGSHTLEIMGDRAEKFYDYPALRLGFYKVDPVNNAQDTFNITQEPSGTSVFRLNESLTWIFSRSTLDGHARQYKIELFKQRSTDKSAVWSGVVELPVDRGRAVARMTYPCDREGAFEYKIYDEKGDVIEGPWEIAVIDPTPLPIPKVGEAQNKPAVLVDTVDCGTEGPGGPHHFRDNGTSKLVENGKLKYRQSGGGTQWCVYDNIGTKKGTFLKARKHVGHYPRSKCEGHPKGVTDCDWFGYTLTVKHPEKPHLIVAYLPNDKYRRIPVEALDPITGHHNGAFMEVKEGAGQKYVKLVFPFWPNDDSIDILTYPSTAYHGKLSTPSAIAKIELYEYPNGLPALAEAVSGWNPGRDVCWNGEQGNLSPEVRTTPRLWEGSLRCPQALSRQQTPGWKFYDYKAYCQAWSRFGEYSRWRGDNMLIWPIHSYSMAHVKTKRLPWGQEPFSDGFQFRPVDKYRRDSLKIILLLCEKYGVDFVGDLQINGGGNRMGAIRKLISVTENVPENELDGLYVEGGRAYPGTPLNPANPFARRFLVHFYGDIAKAYGKYKAFKGINIRQLPWASTVSAWFHNYDVGYGDFTIKLFEKETGVKVPKAKDPKDTYKTRYEFLMNDKKNREIWFRWRADKVFSLREEILAEIRKYAPQMKLFAGFAQPNSALGNGLDERLFADREDLGFGVREANYCTTGIEMNTLDPNTMKNFDIRKGIKQMTPDEKLATGSWIYPMGMCSAGAIFSPPYTTRELALSLAKAPIDVVNAGCYWTLPPADEALSRWVQTWRAIPELDYKRLAKTKNDTVVCWYARNDGDIVAYLINVTDTSKAVGLTPNDASSRVVDMVNGETINPEKIEVEPFGITLLRLEGTEKITGFHVVGESESRIAQVDHRDCEPAWDALDAKTRVLIHVENPSGRERTASVGSISGEDILALLGDRRILDRNLRLFRGGKSIPVQVDAKDGEGFYVKKTFDYIGGDDEVCFPLPFKKGENSCELVLYLDGEARETEKTPYVVERVEERSSTKPYDLLIGNEQIRLGCLGSGIGLLTVGGETIYNGFRKQGRAFIPLLPFAWDDVGEPDILSSGPVRMIVGCGAKKKRNIEWAYEAGNKHFKDALLVGATAMRTYQLLPGSSTILISNQYAYEKALTPVFNTTMWYNREYLNWGGSLSPAKRGDKWTHPTKNLAYSKQGTLISSEWDKLDFSKGIYSSWFMLWDTKTTCGYILAGNPQYISMQSGALMVRYGNRHIPPHRLTIDLWLEALDKEVNSKEAMAWSESHFTTQPMISVIKLEKRK